MIRRINYMHRGGLVEAWRAKFWPTADRCSETATGGAEGSVIQAINVSDMQGAFYLLFGGSGGALLIWIIERLVHRNKRRADSGFIRPYLN